MFGDSKVRSNRTFMELKSGNVPLIRLTLQRSNRTFMELKYYQSPIEVITYLGSNRTFMELKWRSVFSSPPSRPF